MNSVNRFWRGEIVIGDEFLVVKGRRVGRFGKFKMKLFQRETALGKKLLE